MSPRGRYTENDRHYYIPELGIIVTYYGETLVDYHKGDYDSEYKVICESPLKGQVLVMYELDRLSPIKRCTLVPLPANLDIKTVNMETIKTLYGRN